SLTPGALAVQGGRLFDVTADDPLLLPAVQPAGKKAMDAVAWARGLGELDGGVRRVRQRRARSGRRRARARGQGKRCT
ncbi:hypothetical protein IAE22_35900, partial [Bacillus sp. S34]|nr:hypothetical protein [Bacillus sp. S34]